MDARWRKLRVLIPAALAARMDNVNAFTHAQITGDDPVRAFQGWLDEAMRQLVLGINGSWMLSYVRSAGDMALLRAQRLDSASAQTNDRVPQLQTLTFTELQGVCEAVSQQATRTLANGLLTKQAQPAIVRTIQQLIDTVGQRRSDMLISFICVRTFGAVTLDSFRAAGLTHVGTVAERTGLELAPSSHGLVRDAKKTRRPRVRGRRRVTRELVEVLTAGDNKVCPVCEDISEEGPYTLDEAEMLIPAHPRCRCSFVPWHDNRFAPVHDAWSDNARAAALLARQHGAHELLHHVGHHVKHEVKHALIHHAGHATAHHIEEIFHGEHSHEKAHEKLEKEEGYKHESTSDHEHVRVSHFSHPHGHKAEVHTKLDENGDPVKKSTVHRYTAQHDSATHIAAGVMFLDPEGRALFVRRSDTGDHAGEWCFPGGAVEAGETVVQAAVREAEEEVGPIGTFSVDRLEQVDRRELDGVDFTTFVCHVSEIFYPLLNEEHTSACWRMLTNCPEPLHPGVRATVDHAMLGDDYNPNEARDPHGRWTVGNHPAGPYKREVRGSAPERIEGRRLLRTKTDPEKIRAVKLRAIASFWKQHAAAVRAGKLEKAAELEIKIHRYAAKYNIPNPLTGGAPAAAHGITAAPPTSLDQKKAKLRSDLPRLAEVGRSFALGAGGTHATASKLVDLLADRDITAEQFVKGMIPVPTEGKPMLRTNEWSPSNSLSIGANLGGGGSISRHINLDTGTVEHAFFRAGRSGSTGAGMGKEVLRSQIALYEKLGMKKVEVGANIDVGGYAWAKYGFVPHTSEWRSSMRGWLTRGVERLPPSYVDHKGHTITTTDEDKSGLHKLATSDDPKAFWAIADSKHGKKLLLGTSWHGTLNLHDVATMRRFKAYVK